jgi:hypothetical protein
LLAVVRLHDAGEAMHAQDAAGAADRGIDGGHLGRVGGGLFLDDGALTRQITLGADALGAGGRLVRAAVFLE